MVYAWFLPGLFVAGCALIFAGTKTANSLFLSLGGALVGASISSIIVATDNRKILSVLHQYLTSAFRSASSAIGKYQGKWYVYYVTQINGARVWMHTHGDLSADRHVGSLKGKYIIKDKEGNEKVYLAEGGIRDQRVVFFGKEDDSATPTSVDVYPFMDEQYQTEPCGISVIRTWDGTDAIAPEIITRSPLLGWKKIGIIEDQAVCKQLDVLWQKNMNNVDILFPPVKK